MLKILYKAGSLQTAASELARFNLDLVAVQQITGVKVGRQPADNCTAFCGNGSANSYMTGCRI